MRIITEQGVLLIYDAKGPGVTGPFDTGKHVGGNPHNGRSERAARPSSRTIPMLAYWADFADARLYVFGRTLTRPVDAGHALLTLSRDLNIDATAIAMKDALLLQYLGEASVDHQDATSWHPASEAVVEWIVQHSSGDTGVVASSPLDFPPFIPAIGCNPPFQAFGMTDPVNKLGKPLKGWTLADTLSFVSSAGGCGTEHNGCSGSPDPCCGSADPCCGGCCPAPGHCVAPSCGSFDPNDCDGDGIPDDQDTDDDDDGIPDDQDPCPRGECDPPPDPCHGDPCCMNPCSCDPCCVDPCSCLNCDDSDPCTADSCSAGACVNEPICLPSQNCCENGACCNEPCEGCIDNGQLSGGTVTVDAASVCLGDVLTWRIDQDAVDNGGIKRVFCTAKQAIDPVAPSYTWEITKPDATKRSGSGSVATIVTDLPGTYDCTFTASADRECAPPDYDLVGALAAAFTIAATQVDASDPHQAWVTYHLDPPTVVLDSATFAAPGTLQQGYNLQTSFAFSFDQADIIGSGGTIQLQGTIGAATCAEVFSVSKTDVLAPPQSTLQEIAIFRIPFESGLFPIPVTHGIFARFSFLCYEIAVTPQSKTEWFGFGLTNIATQPSSEIPTVIAGWTERLSVSDSSGTIVSGTMTDVTGTTVPAQGPNFRSKNMAVDAWSVPNNGIVAVGRIQNIIFTDEVGSSNLYFPLDALSVNVEVDLPLEENGHVPTTCP